MRSMSVEVTVRFGDKNYHLEREEFGAWPGRDSEIIKFVRETLTEVIADIERLESKEE